MEYYYGIYWGTDGYYAAVPFDLPKSKFDFTQNKFVRKRHFIGQVEKIKIKLQLRHYKVSRSTSVEFYV